MKVAFVNGQYKVTGMTKADVEKVKAARQKQADRAKAWRKANPAAVREARRKAYARRKAVWTAAAKAAVKTSK